MEEWSDDNNCMHKGGQRKNRMHKIVTTTETISLQDTP